MKKTVFSMVLAFALCLSLCVSAWATDSGYIFDEVGALTDTEIEILNEQARLLSDAVDCDLMYAYAQGDLEAFSGDAMPGTRESRILMVENAEYWQVYCKGDADQLVDSTDADNLRALFHDDEPENAPSLAECIRDYLNAAAALAEPSLGGDTTVTTETPVVYDAQTYSAPLRLTDSADILTDAEESALLEKLDEVSMRQQFDVVLVTVTDTGAKSLTQYADDFFDYNGFGFGDDRDGVLYLVRVNEDGTYSTGNSWISTSGLGITAFSDSDIQDLGSSITPDLLNGNYVSAFNEYIETADKQVTKATTFNISRSLVISLIIGLIVAFIATGVMKGKLKTVRRKASASDYLKPGSLQLNGQSDVFLYSNVVRTAKPKDTGSSGGSSTHTSSSGSTHGGGGF
ncbi:MAG: TPM domain-containing protein [Oscillospiraceae bacterium]|nr:TPM domain-containing protein [Oscillospiraceae bacterium]